MDDDHFINIVAAEQYPTTKEITRKSSVLDQSKSVKNRRWQKCVSPSRNPKLELVVHIHRHLSQFWQQHLGKALTFRNQMPLSSVKAELMIAGGEILAEYH